MEDERPDHRGNRTHRRFDRIDHETRSDIGQRRIDRAHQCGGGFHRPFHTGSNNFHMYMFGF